MSGFTSHTLGFLGFGTLLLVASSPLFAQSYKNDQPALKTTGHYKEIAYKQPVYKQPVYKEPVKPLRPPLILADGPYLAGALGYDSYKVHQFTQFTGTTTSTYSPTLNATGLFGALLAGYGRTVNTALYLGFEAFIDTSSAYQSSNYDSSNSTDSINYNAKFFASSGYGANFIPGLKLSDSALIFLRLGYQIARLRGEETLIDNTTGGRTPTNSSNWSGGFAYGLGFEEALIENFSLRGDYIHTDYPSFTATSGTEYFPSNNQFLLALVYHFT